MLICFKEKMGSKKNKQKRRTKFNSKGGMLSRSYLQKRREESESLEKWKQSVKSKRIKVFKVKKKTNKKQKKNKKKKNWNFHYRKLLSREPKYQCLRDNQTKFMWKCPIRILMEVGT